MKNTISLGRGGSLFHYPCTNASSDKAVLVVPNGAGYYATMKKHASSSQPLDIFLADLAEQYHTYYGVLPGQTSGDKIQYSYENSVTSTKEALLLVRNRQELIGVIGMCAGGAIAAQAISDTIEKVEDRPPLMLYNTAVSVGWSDPTI